MRAARRNKIEIVFSLRHLYQCSFTQEQSICHLLPSRRITRRPAVPSSVSSVASLYIRSIATTKTAIKDSLILTRARRRHRVLNLTTVVNYRVLVHHLHLSAKDASSEAAAANPATKRTLSSQKRRIRRRRRRRKPQIWSLAKSQTRSHHP